MLNINKNESVVYRNELVATGGVQPVDPFRRVLPIKMANPTEGETLDTFGCDDGEVSSTVIANCFSDVPNVPGEPSEQTEDELPAAATQVSPEYVFDRLMAYKAGVEKAHEEYSVKKYVPFPYSLSQEGISKLQKNRRNEAEEPTLISGPVVVYALTKGLSGSDFGLVLRGRTQNNEIIERAISSAQLHGNAVELAQMLEGFGVRVVHGQEKRLAAYLDASRTLEHKWLLAVRSLGWMRHEKLAFMLPAAALGADDVVFQPEVNFRSAEYVRSSGRLEEWHRQVGEVCYEDDLTLFTIMLSLAAPLLQAARSDTFGVHFFGTTSRGKTTLLQIAASVWGNGADPNADSAALTRKWNATSNALEALAEEHTDIIFPLDELGSFRASSDLGQAIYNLCGGQGASRLNRSAQKRATREWRTVIVSSGEMGVAEAMNQAGQSQKGGQAIRMLDIPLSGVGLFHRYPDAASTINQIKSSCAKHFGLAGPQFIQWLIGRYGVKTALAGSIEERMGTNLPNAGNGASPELARAAKRFALVGVAGELALEAGILRCGSERLKESVQAVWDIWSQSVPQVNDGQRAIEAVREFIKTYISRFPLANSDRENVGEIYGFQSKSYYLFNEFGFKKAIGNMSRRTVIEALENENLLYVQGGRRKTRHFIVCLDARATFYALRREIMRGEEEHSASF